MNYEHLKSPWSLRFLQDTKEIEFRWDKQAFRSEQDIENFYELFADALEESFGGKVGRPILPWTLDEMNSELFTQFKVAVALGMVGFDVFGKLTCNRQTDLGEARLTMTRASRDMLMQGLGQTEEDNT